MKRLALIAVLSMLALAGIGTQSASAAMGGCFGAPADYVQAFDTVRGQSSNGQVDYPDVRIFIDYQGWLTPADGVSVPGHHSEHLHWGACVPLNETILSRHLDVRFTFHNVLDYTVTQPRGTIVDANGAQAEFAYTAAQVAELNAAAQASGDVNTKTVFQSYVIPTPAHPTNGIKEARVGINVHRSNSQALVDDWFIDCRFYYVENIPGAPTVDPVSLFGPAFLKMRNWIHWTPPDGSPARTSYFYAGYGDSLLAPTGSTPPPAWRASVLRKPKPANWNLNFRTTDGASNGGVQIDPDHHVHPDFNGIWDWYIGAHKSDTNYPLTIPLGSLGLASGSIHKLVLFGDSYPSPNPNPIAKPLSRSVVVLPFKAPL